jgi:predicted house-cleaning noncanonical NTP pyrophosphatase (MazG superfamily)
VTNVYKSFTLPNELRGKKINSDKIIPTVCNIKNMLDKLRDKAGEFSNLEQWEKRCYKHYNIEAIQTELLAANDKERIEILRKHLLNNGFNTLGASPFDIYIVAYVTENIGTGKDIFIKYCLNSGMAGKEGSANAIYRVGKGDGVYLNILNIDGTVKDWEFMHKWVYVESSNTQIKVYNKLVRDKIPEIIMKSGKSCIVQRARAEEKSELLKAKLREEVKEFLEEENIEELADIMEVLFGLANNLGYSEEDLIRKREEKREERGGFIEGIVLEKVY